MKIELIHDNFMKNSLHNCSVDCTRAEPENFELIKKTQVYGQGIILGMVSIIMAQGIPFDGALDFIKMNLPKNFDPNCMPKAWR